MSTEPLKQGTYGVFVYFWADPTADWRVAAGLSNSDVILFQQDASQHAEIAHFSGTVNVVSAHGTEFLYRGYIGRVQVAAEESIDVFVDDINGGAALRTWYDGIGYSLVTLGLPGVFNNDGMVSLADYTVWRDNLGGSFDLNGNGDESGASSWVVDAADYTLWKNSFGTSQVVLGVSSTAKVPAPPATLLSSFLAIGGWLIVRR